MKKILAFVSSFFIIATCYGNYCTKEVCQKNDPNNIKKTCFIQHIPASDKVWYAGGSKGVFVSNDSKTSWKEFNKGLPKNHREVKSLGGYGAPAKNPYYCAVLANGDVFRRFVEQKNSVWMKVQDKNINSFCSYSEKKMSEGIKKNMANKN